MRPRLAFITTYDSSRQSLGGASWVDDRVVTTLRQQFDVTYIPVVEEGAEPSVPLEMSKNRWAIPLVLLRMLVMFEPYQAAKFMWSRSWKKRVSALNARLNDVQPDIIVTSQWPAILLLSQARNNLPHVHIAHNVDAVLAREHDPALFRLFRNAKRTDRNEIALLEQAMCVFALSGTDTARLRAKGINAMHLVLLQREHLTVAPPSVRRIGFIGKASWPPNIRAIDTLVDEVIPELRRRQGSSAPDLLLAGAGTEHWSRMGRGITGVGIVDDLQDFYCEIDLVVVPRIGTTTGISVKLLEALEHNIGVIAPRIMAFDAGVEGLCFCAETVSDIISSVEMFYESSELGHARFNQPAQEAIYDSIGLSSLPDFLANNG